MHFVRQSWDSKKLWEMSPEALNLAGVKTMTKNYVILHVLTILLLGLEIACISSGGFTDAVVARTFFIIQKYSCEFNPNSPIFSLLIVHKTDFFFFYLYFWKLAVYKITFCRFSATQNKGTSKNSFGHGNSKASFFIVDNNVLFFCLLYYNIWRYLTAIMVIGICLLEWSVNLISAFENFLAC